MSVTASAPGKINLFFTVGALQPDGFHEVVSIYQALNLRETVSVTAAKEFSLTVSGIIEGVPTDETNLAIKAAKFVSRSPLAIHIEKTVPVAGGMGGGSADAAAVIVAASKMCGAKVTASETVALGSDVPFAILGGTALGTGRGELLTPLETTGEFHWVLVPAALGLSTPEVYRTLDELRPKPEERDAMPLIAALRKGVPSDIAPLLHNDLQQAALHLRPELQETIDALESAGALRAMVSGSGPTILALVESADEAMRIAEACGGIATSGPALGAHV
jgi:4-diphosphocytidyl-2-C-methyl-D-erythritol kinase